MDNPTRQKLPSASCPLADSNLFHLYLSWRDRGIYTTKKRLLSKAKPEGDDQERGRRIRRARVFFDACYHGYQYSIDLPALTAFHAASILKDDSDVTPLFNGVEWKIVELTSQDARKAGEIAKSVRKLEILDDEFPIISAQAIRLKRAVATANPERYSSIQKNYPELVVIDILKLPLP